jgi:hypothetical protein
MDAPALDRPLIRRHLAEVEKAWPIRFLGVLPPGTMGHVTEADSLTFLADAAMSISLLNLATIEVELSDRFGKPVGVLATSALRGNRDGEIRRSLVAL